MTKFNKLNKATTKLIIGSGVLILMVGFNPLFVPMANAEDCLLDTNHDGDADSNVDTDGAAASNDSPVRLACGANASAGGANATALGSLANAAGAFSVALGYDASAAGDNSTALGVDASAAGLESTVLGRSASAAGSSSIAMGRSASAAGDNSTALGRSASAADNATALGRDASAAGVSSTALGRSASAAGNFSTAVGNTAKAAGGNSTALGYFANFAGPAGQFSTALGSLATARGLNAIAIGADTSDADFVGADAQGDDSIVIGSEASDANFNRAVVIGTGAAATETDQVILKSADTFTILGNGDVGLGTATPMGNLDINSGVDDTVLLLTNTSAQWELKSKAATGRLNFKNVTASGVPFKLGPNSVNGLLSVGTMADDLVEVRGELMVEGDVDVTGTLTTGGPTCGGGCDAVFDANYDLLTIEEHAAQMFANSYLPQVGPTVPHAPMNISEKVGDMLNELEKAHIYIDQLNGDKKALETKVDQQGMELALIKQQIEYLLNH